MPLDLLATALIGLTAGGMVWLAYRTRRRKPPGFLIPLATGAAMLGYAIWNEYSWASRAIAAFPPGFEVIDRIPQSSPWQPWTYLVPRTSRMIVLDRVQMRRNPRYPGLVLIELVLLERLLPAKRVMLIVDCRNARRSDVTDGGLGFDHGLPPENVWAPLQRDGALFKSVCPTPAG